MQPLRLTLVTTSYPVCPGSSSGIFVARMLDSLGDSVVTTVVTPSASCAEEHPAGRHALRLFRYAPRSWERLAHSPGGIPVALRTQPMLRSLVPPFLLSMTYAAWRQATNSDALHANWAICGCAAGLAGRLRGKPVVTTLRGEDVTRGLGSRSGRAVLKCALSLSAAVVTVSDFMREMVGNRWPRWAHKVVTIPNGVDERFLALGRNHVPWDASRPLEMATVGSLIPRKGIEELLTAVAEVHVPKGFRLTVAGDGPERADLEARSKALGLGDQVRFLGAVEADRVHDLMRTSDLFLLASRSEGRPNVVLEAMASGLPVVASDIAGVRELITHGVDGLLYPVGQPAKLSRAIETLAREPDRVAEMGARAHRSVIDRRLLWERTGEDYLSLYRSLLERQVSQSDRHRNAAQH